MTIGGSGTVAGLGAQHVEVAVADELLHREQQLGVAAGQHVERLEPLEAGVERDDDTTGAVDAGGGDDPFADVVAPDRDRVAGLDARREQGPGDLLSLGRELPVGHVDGVRLAGRGRVVGDRVGVAVLLRCPPKRRWHRGRRRDLCAAHVECDSEMIGGRSRMRAQYHRFLTGRQIG